MIRILSLGLALTLLITSCTHHAAPTTKAAAAPAAAAETSLLVSFASRGSGINHAAYDKLKAYLDQYNEKATAKIAIDIRAAGREGEKDVCLQANGNKQFADVVTQVTTLLKDEKLVNIQHKDCSKK
jgi:ABC-type glycerol-3-phosphate transport system substrate-binding protein